MQEGTADSESACTGDGLCDDHAVESAGAGSVCEESSGLCELGDTGDAGVFLVELCGNDFVFSGSYGGEDVGFALVVTICANTLNSYQLCSIRSLL